MNFPFSIFDSVWFLSSVQFSFFFLFFLRIRILIWTYHSDFVSSLTRVAMHMERLLGRCFYSLMHWLWFYHLFQTVWFCRIAGISKRAYSELSGPCWTVNNLCLHSHCEPFLFPFYSHFLNFVCVSRSILFSLSTWTPGSGEGGVASMSRPDGRSESNHADPRFVVSDFIGEYGNYLGSCRFITMRMNGDISSVCDATSGRTAIVLYAAYGSNLASTVKCRLFNTFLQKIAGDLFTSVFDNLHPEWSLIWAGMSEQCDVDITIACGRHEGICQDTAKGLNRARIMS